MLRLSLLLGFVILLNTSLKAQPTYSVDQNRFPDKHRQFDFWIGEWDVNLKRIHPDNTWHEWKNSIARVYPILGGKAILELWEDQSEGSPEEVIIGYSLRYYNPDSGKWHLWLNWPGKNRSGSSHLEGQFQHGRGEFFRERPTSDTTSVLSRYTFSDITENSLRWDDAFSTDGGKTWSNNWIMEFTRNKDRAPWDKNENYALHTYRHGNRCDQTQFIELRKFAGSWKGKMKYLNDDEWKVSQATLNSYRALGGCSIMSFLNYKKEDSLFREFSLKTFNTFIQKFEDGRLDNHPDSHYRPMFGEMSENIFELSRINRETGEVQEKYIWDLSKWKKIGIEKWELRNRELTKTLEGEFEKD